MLDGNYIEFLISVLLSKEDQVAKSRCSENLFVVFNIFDYVAFSIVLFITCHQPYFKYLSQYLRYN